MPPTKKTTQKITISEYLKNNAAAVTAIFSTIATIGGAVLYIEHNFANAEDLGAVIKQQSTQQRQMSVQQRQMTIFQLEYYDDKIRKLQEEKRVAEERERLKINTRSIQKTATELQEELNDIKQRRELVRKIIVEEESTAAGRATR